MKYFSLLLIFCLSLSSQQYWDYVPGVHNFIHDVYIPDNNPDLVIVAADSIPIELGFRDLFPSYYSSLKGSGIVISRDGGQTFNEYPTIDSSLVIAVRSSANNPDEIIASISIKNEGQFARSTDAGVTWDIDYSECVGAEKFVDFVAVDNVFYGAAVSTGRGFYTSENDFQTCAKNDSLNIASRDIDYADGSLFMAGDNSARPGVYRSQDLGKTWIGSENGLSGLRIHCVDPTAVYQEFGIVLCGADKSEDNNFVGAGIYISRNNGLDWSLAGANGSIVYDIEHHPIDPLLVAAACGEDGIYFSTNGGIDWAKQYNEGLPDGADVRLVYFPKKQVQETGYEIFAGVYNSGLYKSKNITPTLTSVNENLKTEYDISINAFPNPAYDHINLNLISKYNSEINYELYSMTGDLILSGSDFLSSNLKILRLNLPTSLANGSYYLRVSNDKVEVSKVIIIQQP